MKKHIINVLLLSSIAFFSACAQSKVSVAGFYKYETECMGSELDGTQMVKAYGEGKSKRDAIEQAKKNAMNTVLFKGITMGEGCLQRPLITNPSARDDNATYFNKFFTDKGTYDKFISMKDSPEKYIKVRKDTGNDKVYGVEMTIKMTELVQELTKKGFIQKDTQ